ncbi:hypothetical protein [Paenibacillus sp. 32352]|uniref:hypothetical protein n=1 Tax=Paenibacillus sp. 32352 TaxID=1969111 RepID=UPI00117EE9CF|nr:hypothetical protein [Paenibacillus sp. 32352]
MKVVFLQIEAKVFVEQLVESTCFVRAMQNRRRGYATERETPPDYIGSSSSFEVSPTDSPMVGILLCLTVGFWS